MKKGNIIALLVIAVSIGIIVSTYFDASTYETFATARQSEGKEFHLIGKLVQKDEMYYNPVENPNYFSFFLEDGNGDIAKVVFHDTKPQDFEKSEEIVLVGKMEGETFRASEILLKCPSKYKDGELEMKSYKAEP